MSESKDTDKPTPSGQIKSKQRVAEHGEVFTAEREVNAMLDLVRQETERIDSRFLEPACGNGNFLVEILRRKLLLVHSEVELVQAVGSIYGIDIMQDNVQECRERLLGVIERDYGKLSGDLLATVRYILDRNILWGDALTLCEPVPEGASAIQKRDAEPITFCEWAFIADRVARKDYHLAALLQAQTSPVPDLFSDLGEEAYLPPKPCKEYKPIHYLKLHTQDATQ